MEHLASRFAKWQLPDEIVIAQELPKTSVGKLAKRALRDTSKKLRLKAGWKRPYLVQRVCTSLMPARSFLALIRRPK
jgi:hypothetical protein